MEKVRVLFVCTHNSARSIMAEALLRERGADRFEAFSAGIEPGEVRPLTLRVLSDAAVPTAGLHSKSVEASLEQLFDYVVTVCDDAKEACPTFPGEAQRLHWSFEDPSKASGSEAERLAVFENVLTAIEGRIDAFIASAGAPGR